MIEKEFLYFIEAKDKKGRVRKIPVYRSGDQYYLDDKKADKGEDLEEAIERIFGLKVMGAVPPHSIHDETKFS